MNFCELDILKNIKKAISDDVTQEVVIDTVAKEVASANGQELSFVKNRLNQLFAEENNMAGPNALQNLLDFFRVNGTLDHKAYNKVKKITRQIILEYILDNRSMGRLVRSNEDLNISLDALVNEYRACLNYKDDITSPLIAYYNIEADKQQSFLMPDNIAAYLIATHLPVIIQSWLNDVIGYDPDSGLYAFNVKHDIREDYREDYDKEANLNAMLEIMLAATPLKKFDADGYEEEVYENRTLVKTSLFYSINKELEVMPESDYVEYLKNPYYLIDYLVKKYAHTGSHANRYENIIHSFLDKWVYSAGRYTAFYKNSQEGATEFTGYNPLDIFIKSFDKYRTNIYLDYNIDEGADVLSLEDDENSKAYGQLMDHVNSRLFSLDNPVFNGAFVKNSKDQYLLSDSITEDELSDISRYIFGEHIDVDEGSFASLKDAIQQILDFKNQTAVTDFTEFLKQKSGKEKRASKILTVLNIINAYNPYSIKGSAKNAEGTSLPMIGLGSVANTIEDQVYRNRIRLSAIKESYKAANLTIPVSPFEQTTLFNTHKKGSENNIFLRTVYRSTIRKDIDGELEIKGVGNLSILEAFKLAFIEDFLKGWKAKEDSRIRFQAITPSDKPRIPLFEESTFAIKSKFGTTNKEIEKKVISEIRNIYAQNLVNTVNNFIDVLGARIKKLDPDAKNVSNEELLKAANSVNKYLKSHNISETILNTRLLEFNKKHNVNKLISKVHDYVSGKDSITISPYSISTIEMFSDPTFFDKMYLESLKLLSYVTPVLDTPFGKIDVNALMNSDKTELSETAKNSDLYTFFLLKNLVQENILTNTVGTPLTHKNKGGDYFAMDSASHLTMVKRMVALTATMHSCMPNVLSGLSNQINTMSFKNSTAEMWAYSGNASSGKGFTTELDVADGAMYTTGIVNNLLKQSITDTKPGGIDVKLLLHSLNAEKGTASLAKMACYVIDNRYLRLFSDPNAGKIEGTDPRAFVKLALEGTSINPDYSINEDGEIVDYDGNYIEELDDVYVKENNIVYRISGITYNPDTNTFSYKKTNTVTKTSEILEVENDLYQIWGNMLGGEYSCDKNGEYGEQSMDIMTLLLNKLGRRLNSTDSIDSQNNIDQYAKKNIVHYFPTSSAQKSSQPPLVTLEEAIADRSKRYTSKEYIENFGVQLDPDHTAEDGEIHEITQLISFITEKNFVPEKVKQVYTNLGKLVGILATKTFVDPSAMIDPEQRMLATAKLNRIFGQKIERIFADPTLDVMGLANELMKEIKESKALNPPYSDHQLLGKLHTTVGSYFNKFIARMWTGRGDVLVPSHNMCMLYEDDEGVTYFKNDFKYLSNGNTVSITEYLESQVWENGYGSKIRDSYIQTHKVSPYEVAAVDVYYLVNPVTGNGIPYVMDTWEKINQTRENIKKGMVYVRAIDLPRNLRSKLAFVNVDHNGTKERISIYHFKTMQKIAMVSQLLDDKKTSYPVEIEGIQYDKQGLANLKKELQNYFADTVLVAIHDKNLPIIQSELPSGVPLIEDFDYEIYEEERLTTNNYAKVFGIKGMNFSEIKQKKDRYFKEKLIEKFQKISVPYDYLMYASNGKPTAIITTPKLLDKSVYKETYPVVDEEGYRVDHLGNQLYKWPENAKLYQYTLGNIVVEAIYLNDDDLETVLDSNPFAFYRSNKELNRKNLYNLDSANNDAIFSRIAKKQYESWLKSNESVMSRIPAQSLSFAMVINTVGYLPWSNNITMVPNMNVFLEGSDYDIDKAYAIMAALDRNGLYKEAKEGTLSIVTKNIDLGTDLTEDEISINLELGRAILNNNKEELEQIISKINDLLDTQDIRISKEYLVNINNYNVRYGEDEVSIWKLLSKPEISRRVDSALRNIRMELLSKTSLENSKVDVVQATQNLILEAIKDIYRDPRTLMASTDPTTMDPVNDVVKEMNLEAAKRNHFNFMTDTFVNQTTSVGKSDIGISAVAQKAFYALTYYYNTKFDEGKSVSSYFSLKLPNSWGGKVLFNIGYPGQKINQATIDALADHIRSTFTEVTQSGVMESSALYIDPNSSLVARITTEDTLTGTKQYVYIGENKDSLKLLKVGDRIDGVIPTTTNSSIISSSTDNAKEMKMDLLNATPEILSAYEFCLSLGVPIKQAAVIFTDPIINAIITVSRGDLFSKQRSVRTISKLLTNNQQLEKVRALYENYLGKKVDKEDFTKKVNVLVTLFKGAEELTNLGQLLGINGGIKVEFGAPLLFQLRVENIVNSATGEDSFSIEKFLNNPIYAQIWVDKLEKHKINFNILDVINSVPHYKAMFTVPIQFKKAMQLLSKDVDTVYSLAYKKLSKKYRVDETVLRNVLRLVNDHKIFAFFSQTPFKYQTNMVWERASNNNNVEKMVLDSPTTLSTDTFNGLISLKPYIETVIIPEIKSRYPNNSFANNLIMNSIFNSLFQERVSFVGSRIDLSNPQYEDITLIIKDHFYKIQNEVINGHSIYEWMFIYDLLVNKHYVGGNSMTMLLDNNLNLQNPDNIVTKWVNFINTYDSMFSTVSNLEELTAIPNLKDIFGRDTDSFMEIFEGLPDYILGELKSSRPGWAINPNYLPLFVSIKNFGRQPILSKDDLFKAFSKGIVTVKLC